MDDVEQQVHGSKLSWRVVIGYGYGSLGIYLAPMITAFFLNPFLLEVAGIEPAAAGSIMLVGNFVDAFSDPMIGYLSDHTPWGPRRIPWIAFATIPFIYFYIMLWLVPNWPSYALIAYYVIIYISRTICLTCITVPYNSLSAELTQSYDERSRLAGSRWIFSLVVGTICIAVQSYLTELFYHPGGETVNYEKGYAVAAIILGLFMGTATLSILMFVKEPPRGSIGNASLKTPLIKGIISALRNKPFILLILMFTTSWISLNLLSSNLFLYIKYVVQLEKYYTIILFSLLAFAAISMPFWAFASRKWGKKTVFYLGSIELVVFIAFLSLVPSGLALWITLIVSSLSGIGLAVLYLIPYSMIPDVIEYDQLRTGERREGTFFSLYIFFEKFGLAISLALGGYALQLAGYESGSNTQSQSVLITLRVLVGVIPTILLLTAMVCVYFYPITKQYHADILRQLTEKQKGLLE